MDKAMEPKINGMHQDNGEQQMVTANPMGHIPEPSNAFADIPICAQWWRDTNDLQALQNISEQQMNMANTGNVAFNPNSGVTVTMQPSIVSLISVQKTPTKKGKSRSSGGTSQAADVRGRIKNPDTWKVNVKKNARLRGEEYVGGGGKIVPAKVMGPPCDCRMRCADKMSEDDRTKLHEVFWKTCDWDQRKQYVALLVKESPKHRTRIRGKDPSETRRQVTFTYSLLINGQCITVCKQMFLSTFSISEKFVRHAMDKKRSSPGGIIGPDQRGRHSPKIKKPEEVRNLVREHIKSFPTFKSENPRDRKRYLEANLSIAAMHKLYVQKCEAEGVPACDIVKESYYRGIFKSEFDYGFKAPLNAEKK